MTSSLAQLAMQEPTECVTSVCVLHGLVQVEGRWGKVLPCLLL